MKFILGLIFFILVLITAEIIAVKLFAQGSSLSELSKLQAENFKLTAKLNSCQLTIEQGRLTEKFRKELNASQDQEFDWNSLSFIVKPSSSK